FAWLGLSVVGADGFALYIDQVFRGRGGGFVLGVGGFGNRRGRGRQRGGERDGGGNDDRRRATAPQTQMLLAVTQVDLAQFVLGHKRDQRFDRLHVKRAGFFYVIRH